MATMFQIIQFLDGNGDPYDSGAVYWFEAGTSTPKDTWVDEAESATAANPVLLDSDGRPDHGNNPNAMWLRGSYKMVLKDAPDPLGSTIITIDNINLYDQLDWTGLTATIADLNSTSTVALLKTTTYSVVIADRGKTILADATGGGFTINLPAAATAGNKFKIIIKKIDNSVNAVTIDPNASETIDLQTTYLLSDYFDFIEIHCDGSNWYTVASQIRGTIRTITGTTTLGLEDNNKVINANASGGAFNISLPSAATVGKGWAVTVKKIDSSTNAVTLVPDGVETIDGSATESLSSQYFAITIKSDGVNWYIVSEYGDNATGGAWPQDYKMDFFLEQDSGDTQHDIKFNKGSARGVNNITNLIIGAAGLVKQIDVQWEFGNAKGGYPSSGPSLTTNTWYHCFIIGKPDGTTDAGFDSAINAANLLATAAGYTDYLRVGSVKTDGSSNITDFTMVGFLSGQRITYWTAPVTDINQNDPFPGGAQTLALTTPLGVQTEAMLIGYAREPNSDFDIWIWPTFTNRPLNVTLNVCKENSGSAEMRQTINVVTNTSRQIKWEAANASGVNSNFQVETLGWIE